MVALKSIVISFQMNQNPAKMFEGGTEDNVTASVILEDMEKKGKVN